MQNVSFVLKIKLFNCIDSSEQYVIPTCCPVENFPLVRWLVNELIVHNQLRFGEAIQMMRTKRTVQTHRNGITQCYLTRSASEYTLL